MLGIVALVDLLAGRLVELQEERDSARVFRLRPLIPRRWTGEPEQTDLTAA
ncbi:MAG TPA: hypothetical protein VG293_09565 [Solirubrobacteraceae bacterium]|jgi:hypothetical protein|nr:hypothetical protein [Solirubrobacteraceae bacterium]